MSATGPTVLFTAWALHDIEEALAFPATCDALASSTGLELFRIDKRQSWTAVGLMGVIVAVACWKGARSDGRSRFYRAVTAGLEGHALTHLAASIVQKKYTAGVATAMTVMFPGAVIARRELARNGVPLKTRNYAAGAVILIPAAILCQVLARMIPRSFA